MGVYSRIISSMMKNVFRRPSSMDRYAAEKLADAVEKHPALIPLNRDEIIATLEQAYVPESSMFHAALPKNRQPFPAEHCHFSFSLRRVLRNRNARPYQQNPAKWIYARTIDFFGGYSSDDMTRRIRMNRELVKMMRESPQEFSLLGKWEVYDVDNPDETVYILTVPMLFIPGAADEKKVRDWERAHVTYEVELGGILRPLRHAKRIRPQDYRGKVLTKLFGDFHAQ